MHRSWNTNTLPRREFMSQSSTSESKAPLTHEAPDSPLYFRHSPEQGAKHGTDAAPHAPSSGIPVLFCSGHREATMKVSLSCFVLRLASLDPSTLQATGPNAPPCFRAVQHRSPRYWVPEEAGVDDEQAVRPPRSAAPSQPEEYVLNSHSTKFSETRRSDKRLSRGFWPQKSSAASAHSSVS
jgi:hypothetical protein